MGSRVVASWRAEQKVEFRRALGLGAGIVTAGGCAAIFAAATGATVGVLAAVMVVACGPLFTILRMQRLLRDESQLTVRTDGILLRRADDERFFPWDDVARIALTPAGGVCITCRDGSVHAVPFALQAITPAELVARLERVRLQEGLGLLR